MSYTHNNHLKFYVNDVLYGTRKTSLDTYRVEVGSVDWDHYRKLDLTTEFTRIADLIYADYGKEVELYFSGGTDCEIVLKSFLSIGIKPRLITIQYSDGSNLFEVHAAIKLASEYGLKIHIVDFDMREFFHSGAAAELATQIYCSQLFFCVIYDVVRQRGQPAVMGGNVPLTRKVGNYKSFWYYTYMETEESSSIRFSRKFNIPVTYEFFSYTPEAMLYYLDSDDIKNLVYGNNYKLKLESSKNAILNKFVPNLRLRTKTHGWEKILPFAHEAEREIMSNQVNRLTDCLDGIEYTECIAQLKGIK